MRDELANEISKWLFDDKQGIDKFMVALLLHNWLQDVALDNP